MPAESSNPFAAMLGACIVATRPPSAGQVPGVPASARRWWDETSPAEKRHSLVQPGRLAMLALQSAVDTGGDLWAKDSPARPGIEALIRRFAGEVFEPFTRANGILPTDLPIYQRQIFELCQVLASPGYLEGQIALTDMEGEFPDLGDPPIGFEALRATGREIETAILRPIRQQGYYLQAISLLTSSAMLAAAICYTAAHLWLDRRRVAPASARQPAFHTFCLGFSLVFEPWWDLILSLDETQFDMRALGLESLAGQVARSGPIEMLRLDGEMLEVILAPSGGDADKFIHILPMQDSDWLPIATIIQSPSKTASDLIRPSYLHTRLPAVADTQATEHASRIILAKKLDRLRWDVRELLRGIEGLIDCLGQLMDGWQTAGVLQIEDARQMGIHESMEQYGFSYFVDSQAIRQLRLRLIRTYQDCTSDLEYMPIEGVSDILRCRLLEQTRDRLEEGLDRGRLNRTLRTDAVAIFALTRRFDDAQLFRRAWFQYEPGLWNAHNLALAYLDWAEQCARGSKKEDSLRRWWDAVELWAPVLDARSPEVAEHWRQRVPRDVKPQAVAMTNSDLAAVIYGVRKRVLELLEAPSWKLCKFEQLGEAHLLYDSILELFTFPPGDYQALASATDLSRQPLSRLRSVHIRELVQDLHTMATCPELRPKFATKWDNREKEMQQRDQSLFLRAEYPLSRVKERYFGEKATDPVEPPFPLDFSGYALIVGMGNYEHLPHLMQTVNDAQDIYDLLVDPSCCGYRHVELLLEKRATRPSVIEALAALSHVPADATVLVYFAGHGARQGDGPGARNYLCTYETTADDLDRTAISGDALAEALRRIPAQKTIVLFDVCHAGGVAQSRAVTLTSAARTGLAESYYQELAQGSGRAIIASCKEDEVSWELIDMRNGIFTHHLLQGLKGEACVHKDGLVRIYDLADYVQREVPQRVSQHPVFHGIAIDQNFPVAHCPHIVGAPHKLAYSKVDPRRLHELMCNYLDSGDFVKLCFNLGVRPSDLPHQGQGLPVLLIALIEYHQHRGTYENLVDEFTKVRPQLVDELFQKPQ